MNMPKFVKALSSGELKELRNAVYDEENRRFHSSNYPAMNKEEIDLLEVGGKIQAIKAYRDRNKSFGSGVDLRTAKLVVEAYMRIHPPKTTDTITLAELIKEKLPKEVNVEISTKVLKKLPTGRFIRIETVRDMDGKGRKAIIWMNAEDLMSNAQAFDIKTGDYLGKY